MGERQLAEAAGCARGAPGPHWGPELTPARAFPPTGILPRSWSHYTVPAGMTVIQWVSDFSERIKQLQNISLAAASGGAKELKVVTAAPEQPGSWGGDSQGRG